MTGSNVDMATNPEVVLWLVSRFVDLEAQNENVRE